MRHLVVVIAAAVSGCQAEGDNCFSRGDVEPKAGGDVVLAAQAWLDSLDDGQRGRAAFALDAPERHQWTNLPDGAILGRPGLRTGDMTDVQCEAAAAMLFAAIPVESAKQILQVMKADDVLGVVNQPNQLRWSSDNYYWSVYGEPSADEPWALLMNGHHSAVSVAFKDGHMSRSPDFLGLEPTEVELDGVLVKPLEAENDTGFELANALAAADLLEDARIEHPADGILLGAGQDDLFPTVPEGIAAADMDEAQRALLRDIVALYARRLMPADGDQLLADFDRDVDEARFAWSGDVQDDSLDAYYRVHAPAIWIELSYEGAIAGSAGGAPHYHSVMRDPRHDYGAGL